MNKPWAAPRRESCSSPQACHPLAIATRTTKKATNKALIHVPAGNKTWVAKYTRMLMLKYRPAGASSSARDPACWRSASSSPNCSFEASKVIDPDGALGVGLHVPHAVSGPPATPGSPHPLLRLGLERLLRRPRPAHARALGGLQPWCRDRRLTAPRRAAGHRGPDQWPAAGHPRSDLQPTSWRWPTTAPPTVDWIGFTSGASSRESTSRRRRVDDSKAPALGRRSWPRTTYTPTPSATRTPTTA